jgi:signal transduction histidine kinase
VIEEIKIPKRISIEKDYKSGNKVMFDFFQIKQAMINVIKNAVESIENEGWISLKTYKKGDSIRIDIADSGCGIKEEDREKIFEPLFSKKDMGTGLGLCIVKDIIERHKGNIIVESQEGIGTKVIITIPIAG